MAVDRHLRTFLLLIAMSYPVRSQTVLNTTSEGSSPMSHTPRPPLLIQVKSNIGKPGAVLYNLQSENVLIMDYTLQCLSHDTVYQIIATTSAENIAHITSTPIFNISCANAVQPVMNLTATESSDLASEENERSSPSSLPKPVPTFVGVVMGQANVTISASSIGRSFFILLANKLSGPDMPMMVNPMSLIGPDGPSYSTDNPGELVNETQVPGQGQSMEPGQGQNSQPGQGQGMPGLPPGLPPNTAGFAMIIVMQLPRPIDHIFRILVYIVIILATTGMGVKVDLAVVKLVLKKPVAPLIGLFCQYLCMPLIAYGVARLVPQESAAISLGIFACGIVPGGGMSNMFTFLLGGDLSLSVTMTTLSNIVSLGLLPLWIFTLGSTFKDDTVELKVPYAKILETLAIVILPMFLGIFIQFKLPKVGKIIVKVLKPVLFIVVVFLISLGIYTNLFIFKLIRPMTITAGCLLPYIGYFIGGIVALIGCQTWTRVKTIAIETGIQNTGIAFLILFLSLPPPDNQLAAVAPASSAIMTPLPLLLAVMLYAIYKRCINKKREAKYEVNEKKHPDLENGSIVKKSKKEKKEEKKERKREARQALLRELAHGEGTAAIMIIWQRITGNKPEEKVPKRMLNKELELAPPEKENLMKSPRV